MRIRKSLYSAVEVGEQEAAVRYHNDVDSAVCLRFAVEQSDVADTIVVLAVCYCSVAVEYTSADCASERSVQADLNIALHLLYILLQP